MVGGVVVPVFMAARASVLQAAKSTAVGVWADTLTAAATRLATRTPTRARVTLRIEHILRAVTARRPSTSARLCSHLEVYKSYLIYILYYDITMKSSGKRAGSGAANAPRPRSRSTDHGVRNVRLVGGRGVVCRLAGRVRDEGWRIRVGWGSGARSGRERRGGRDLPGSERLRGRGALPDGVRRLRRGGHRARGPAEGLGAHLGT